MIHVVHGPASIINTVLGVPEREFAKYWVSSLWAAMNKTERGHRLNMTSRHTGKTYKRPGYESYDFIDRRADKLRSDYPPKWLRRLQASVGKR